MIERSGKPQSESLPRKSRNRRRSLNVALESMLSIVLLAGSLLVLGAGAAQAETSTPETRRSAASLGIQAIDYYEFRAQHSDKCLDVANASIAHGAWVVQGNCWGGANQHWRLVYAGTWG